jgi:PEGA domain-containing protein
MMRKWILTGAGLMWVALGAETREAKVWAAPQDKQQKPAYTLAEHDAYTAADSQQNLQQKIKQLDDFVKQYPNSTLMPYVYKDHCLTDFALKNFTGTMEYVDRMIALGDEVDVQSRLEALVARAQAYDAGMQNKTLPALDIVVHTKARDAAALGLKTLHDWKKPDTMAKDQFTQNVKSFKVLFKSVQAAASGGVDASSLFFSMQAPFLLQQVAENEAIANKTRGEQAEFELRKKQAAELGLKPGTAEYMEYVSTGKVTNASGQNAGPATGQATIHITSSPAGGEIYIDGKFFGNAPSDIALAPGEHVVRVTLGGKEWTRSVQITGGEIQLRAELP